MPTYSYECVKCEHTFEVFHAMSATPKIKCEECSGKCTKLIGAGAGIIFKGSGFYETDYKDKKGTPPKKEGKTETKSEDKSDAKASTSSGNGKSDSSEKKKSGDAK